jgi:2-polyprenyl-3-methyl-5-hydroxy-6-metoxy-1,4-benzoquinol methylase
MKWLDKTNDDGKMMAGRNYHYPDLRDKIAEEIIRKIELYPGYWSGSEKNITNIIKNLIKEMDVGKRFLDAGCGDGRLIPVFEELFDEVVAIEPDIERLNDAENFTNNLKLSNKITFKRVAIEDFDNVGQFDFILCSHVLQHVHTDAVPLIINNFRTLIKREGLLCITTCHSTKEKSYFTKDFLNKSQLRDVLITKDEFNSLINCTGTLPIHFFKPDEICSLLSMNGFRIIEFRVFHLENGIPGLESGTDIDNAANLDPDLQRRCGRDMLIAAVPVF